MNKLAITFFGIVILATSSLASATSINYSGYGYQGGGGNFFVSKETIYNTVDGEEGNYFDGDYSPTTEWVWTQEAIKPGFDVNLWSANLSIHTYNTQGNYWNNTLQGWDNAANGGLGEWVDITRDYRPWVTSSGIDSVYKLDASWYDDVIAGLQLKLVINPLNRGDDYIKWSELTVYGKASLSPSVVPIPAALWLFGPTLFGFVALRRRFKLI